MDYHLEIIEASISKEYAQYFFSHPFPWILSPDELVPILDNEERAPPHGHRQRRDGGDEEEAAESSEDGDRDGDGDGGGGGDEGGVGPVLDVQDFRVSRKR